MKSSLVAAALALLVGGCTKSNPDFCCLTPEDCSAQGTDDNSRPCKDGLACVENACVAPMCASDGCEADAPVCEVTTGLCNACTGPTDCMRFSATPVCDATGAGDCVECLGVADCTTAKPICDGNACRAAKTDEECDSGALGDDGLCVDEANILYLSPQGADNGVCSKTAPCQDISYAFTKATSVRNHIVFKPGDYTTVGAETGTLAPSFYLHGHQATVAGGDADYATLDASAEVNVRNLTLRNSGTQGLALRTREKATLSHVKLIGYTGYEARAVTMATDLETEVTNVGVRVSGSFVLDRGRIHGGVSGIVVNSGSIDLTNLVLTDMTGVGINIDNGSGIMRFSTITLTGQGNGPTAAFGVHCGSVLFKVQSSIIWRSDITTRPAIEGSCANQIDVTNSFVGAMPLTGVANTNPLFVSDVAPNIHLGAASPARDAADTGPATDFEGDARPSGSKFDIGADEAQ